MSRRRILPLLIALSLAAAGRAGAGPPPSGLVHVPKRPGLSQVERGAELYSANCLSCHGVDGRGIVAYGSARGAGGLKGLGPSLRGVGALSADFYLRTGYMPLSNIHSQPTRSRILFSDGEIRALVAYVASLGKGPAIPRPDPARGNLAQGLQLFGEHCAGCHQIAAQGGYVTGARVPPLEDATPVQIAEAVRVGPYLMPRFGKAQISDRELSSIVAYVQFTKHEGNYGGWAIGEIGPVPEGMIAWLLAAGVLVGFCMLIGKRLKS